MIKQNEKHVWLCDKCDHRQLFSQPELPQHNPRSEQNDDMLCENCGGEMFFITVRELKEEESK